MSTTDTTTAPWDDLKSRQAAADACLRGEPVIFGFSLDATATWLGAPQGWIRDGRPVHIIANQYDGGRPALTADQVAEYTGGEASS